MNLEISEINFDKKAKVFVVSLEGEDLNLTYEDLEEYKLSVGDMLTFDLYKTLLALSKKNEAMQLALKYISTRLVSRYKLRTHLIRKEIPKDTVDWIIADLEKEGLINDQAFIEFYIEDKKNINLRSKKHIASDLVAMGFDSDLIDLKMEAYSDQDEADIAKQLLDKKNYLGRKSQEQLIRYLANRGFKYDSIKALEEKYFMEEIE